MQKLFRFLMLVITFSVLFTMLFIIIPCITWVLGGSFRAVIDEPAYIIFAGIVINIVLGCIFYNTFDEDFYAKSSSKSIKTF